MSPSLTTPSALLARVREIDSVRRAAELELLQLAALWADAHPDLDIQSIDPVEGEEFDEWSGLPPVAWDASAGLGTALGRSTVAADRLIRQALTLRHRLPLHWGMVLDGTLEGYRVRRIADAVAGCPDDICAYIDEHVAPIASTVGAVKLERLLEEAWLLLHEDQVELERLAALESRHVTIDDSTVDHTGVAEVTARADWDDLAAFDETLSAVARALAVQDETADLPADSLDVRRSRALGVLADPARALALLEGRPAPSPTRRTQLNLHLTLDSMLRHGLIGRDGHLDRPLLADAVREWCGRTDRGLTVVPVIDLEDHAVVGQYEISGRNRLRVQLAHPTCASRGAPAPLTGATWTTECPTTRAVCPATATSPDSAADIIGSRLIAATATRSSSPAPSSGRPRTGSGSFATRAAPATSPHAPSDPTHPGTAACRTRWNRTTRSLRRAVDRRRPLALTVSHAPGTPRPAPRWRRPWR